nr:MFS transporter [Bacteroidota bacterium]
MSTEELSLPEEKAGAAIASKLAAAPQKLSVLEKVGYSLGDLAANLVFQTLVTYLAYFYTDIYGLKPEHASILILTVGLVAGFGFNPIIGALADRTNSRWGK